MAEMDTHVRRGHPVLFGLLLLFGIIEGANTSWLVSQYNNNNSYPTQSIQDRSRFLVFVSWWTVVFSAAYLAAFWFAPLSFISSIASHGAWIILTWIFWLAGAAAMTAALGGGLSCGTTVYAYCGQLNASIAFAWIEWIIISVLLILILVIGSAAMRRGDRLSAGLVA